MSSKKPLIIALDVATIEEAERLVTSLQGRVSYFKVGLRLFTRYGPRAVEAVQKVGGQVFLDLKFFDIPNTVAQACESAAGLGVWMVTVHASGGEEMLAAAVEGAGRVSGPKKPPLVVGVTVLTSVEPNLSTTEEVVALARLSKKIGLSGVVCSPHEIQEVRKACCAGFLIVTPGVRPLRGVQGDQKRVATPAEAKCLGADYLVVGRPVLESPDPVKTVDEILSQV